MLNEYDMFIDYDTLCNIEAKLNSIMHDLANSTEQMVNAIKTSQGFLVGNQYEKAKSTTLSCVELTKKTENNIRYAIEYIQQLKNTLEEYNKCEYSGDSL